MWHVVVAGEYARAVDDAGSESEKVPMEGEVQRPAPVRIGLTCGPVRGLAAMQRQLPTMVKGDAIVLAQFSCNIVLLLALAFFQWCQCLSSVLQMSLAAFFYMQVP